MVLLICTMHADKMRKLLQHNLHDDDTRSIHKYMYIQALKAVLMQLLAPMHVHTGQQ